MLALVAGATRTAAGRAAATVVTERAGTPARKAMEARIAAALSAYWRSAASSGPAKPSAVLRKAIAAALIDGWGRAGRAAYAAGWAEPAKKRPRKKAVGRKDVGEWVEDDGPTVVESWLRRWAKKRATERATTITETTRAIAVRTLARVTRELSSQDQGAPPWHIGTGFEERAGNRILPRRARTIARTEVHNAMSEVDRAIAMQLSDDIGPMVKVWCASNDERTRDDHVEADGQKVDAEDSFIVGGVEMDGPGDISAPPEQTVNCRCVLLWEPKGGWE